MDFQSNGMIVDDVMFDRLVMRLPEGVSMTVVFDACHSGSALDLPWKWRPERNEWQEEWNPFFTKNDVVMISGCEDHATSSDGAKDRYGRTGGALTTALHRLLSISKRDARFSYDGLVENLLHEMRRLNYKQRPQLSSMQPFDGTRRLFCPINMLDPKAQIVSMNRNMDTGRIFRRRFPPQPRQLDDDDPLAGLLGLAAEPAVAAGLCLLCLAMVDDG